MSAMKAGRVRSGASDKRSTSTRLPVAEASDPALRRLRGDRRANVLGSPIVQTLMEFPDAHPYKKWWGTHWRLVSLADLEVPQRAPGIVPGVERELDWLTSPRHRSAIREIDGLVRRCASQEGNAVYSCSRLGYADDERVRLLVDSLLEWRWPDGGWNCDENATGRRSSFHETITPALGLAAYHEATGDADALAASRRCAELLLEHRLFRAIGTGKPIHPSWTKLHYPPYWHYDILQGLRLLEAVGMLDDRRAGDALDLVERARRNGGRFTGAAWWSNKMPDAVDWGQAPGNEMLNVRAEGILHAAGRI